MCVYLWKYINILLLKVINKKYKLYDENGAEWLPEKKHQRSDTVIHHYHQKMLSENVLLKSERIKNRMIIF